MAVKIRLMRVGKKKQPTYRVVVADGRSPRDGRFIEIIGQYAPRAGAVARRQIDGESALGWLRKGAQPTEQVQKLADRAGRVGAVRVRARQARRHQAVAPRLRDRQGRSRRVKTGRAKRRGRRGRGRRRAAAAAERAAAEATRGRGRARPRTPPQPTRRRTAEDDAPRPT